MGCLRLNSLPTIWYTVLMFGLQSYLLFLATARYRLHTEIKWPDGGYPQLALTMYISLCGATIPLLFLFIVFGLFKTGNLAGDGEKLGIRTNRDLQLRRSRHKENAVFLFFRSIWRHSSPLPATIHVFAAIIQLLAQQIMIAQLYRFGFINSGDFLNTELDFLYQRARQLATNLPMGDTRLQGFRITSDELTGSPLAPNLLPILMHARLFGVPLEFVNLVVALIAYMATYPSVFWFASKRFAFVFSLFLIAHSVDLIYTYLSFSVLFRIQETNYHSIRPVGLGQYLAPTADLAIYDPFVILVLFVGTVAFMHLMPIILYSYGYAKFYSAKQMASGSLGSPPPPNTGLLDDYGPKRRSAAACCDGFVPHMATAVLLIIVIMFKLPTIYALLLLFQHERPPILLSAIVVELIYLFFTILLWIGLTCRCNWNFRVESRGFGNTAIVNNPPPPANLFDPYRRSAADDKTAAVYKPGSYASIRRPLRPAGLVFAQGSQQPQQQQQQNDYGQFENYGNYSTLRPKNNYGDVSVYGKIGGSPNHRNGGVPNGTPPTAATTITRPLIGPTFPQKPIHYIPQPNQSNQTIIPNGETAQMRSVLPPPPAGITPSSTLTSQNSNTSSFNNHDGQTDALLNPRGSTATLTNTSQQFATSVV